MCNACPYLYSGNEAKQQPKIETMTTQNATPAPATSANVEKYIPVAVSFLGWVGEEMEAASVFTIGNLEGYNLTPLSIQHEWYKAEGFAETHPHAKSKVYVMLKHVSGVAWIFGLCARDGNLRAYLHMYSPKTTRYFADATDAQSVSWDKRVQRLRAKGVNC